MTVALIDGDIVAHRAAAANQMDVQWDEGGPASSHGDAQEAARAAIDTVAAWAALARCKDIIVTFTGRHNFRKLVLPSYKANRAGKVKPLAFKYTVEAVTAHYPTRLIEGLEADDLMGIMATSDNYRDAVVVTLDKDLRTVPGRHLNPLKDARPHVVTEQLATRAWLMQVLTGDPTDGYVGIPGIGPAKGQRILDEPHLSMDLGVLWDRVKRAYAKAGLTTADALQQARVARILRRTDYDKDTKSIWLWHETQPLKYPLDRVLAGLPPDVSASTASATAPLASA